MKFQATLIAAVLFTSEAMAACPNTKVQCRALPDVAGAEKGFIKIMKKDDQVDEETGEVIRTFEPKLRSHWKDMEDVEYSVAIYESAGAGASCFDATTELANFGSFT